MDSGLLSGFIMWPRYTPFSSVLSASLGDDTLGWVSQRMYSEVCGRASPEHEPYGWACESCSLRSAPISMQVVFGASDMSSRLIVQ